MRPRLLFVYLQPTSFVLDDLESLGEHFDVRSFEFAPTTLSRIRTIPRLIGQRDWLKREVRNADIVFGWFADFHMVAPVRIGKKFGVPVVVALGGYDAVHLPRLNYGVFGSVWRAPLSRYVLKEASLLLPVAAALINSENDFEPGPEGSAQGVASHVPGLATPFYVIPTGYDQNAWPLGPQERNDSVCSVAIINDQRTFELKGIDLLFRAAERMPTVHFKIVGVNVDLLPWIQASHSPPPNVEIEPPRPRLELSDVYQSASVYAQISRSEGLPNALCEAMLSGCIPVVSRVGGMPHVVGDVGEVVDQPNIDRVVEALGNALKRTSVDRQAARSKIASSYSSEKRAERLRIAFNQLIQESKK